MNEAVEYIDTTRATLVNGEWYAFDLQGFKFFATVYNNGFTGYLELTQIPDPYEKANADTGSSVEESTPTIGTGSSAL